MRVQITLPRVGIEGALMLKNPADTQMNLTEFGWSPYFMHSGATPPVLYVEVLDKACQVIQRAVLTLSGKTGKLRLQSLSEAVEPAYYKQDDAVEAQAGGESER